MTWIEDYFDLERQIESQDNLIKTYAASTFALPTEVVFNRVVKMMERKKSLVQKFLVYQETFDKLTDFQKQLVILKYKEGKTVSQITKILGKSLRTLFRHLELVSRIIYCEGGRNVNSKAKSRANSTSIERSPEDGTAVHTIRASS